MRVDPMRVDLKSVSHCAMDHPRRAMTIAVAISVCIILLVAVPSIAPFSVPGLNPLHIDTDPENMLPADEPVRMFDRAQKKTFNLHDWLVVGITNVTYDEGVFNPDSLSDIHTLTELAEGLRWDNASGETRGVIMADIIAPSTMDSIEQAGLGAVRFDWLMPEPPESSAEALAVRERAARIPMLDKAMVSDDRRALALYIPMVTKDDSYRVAAALRASIAEFDNGDTYHITGLPIAQDQFGIEMFVQMAIAAPAAMLLIYVLMWWMFREPLLVISPLMVALVSVVGAMGLLVMSGNTVHIMSSMIPIFIMPIAVLDAVHILSEFHDRYPEQQDRRTTLEQVIDTLWQPMLFTTITTSVGFASLALTPIPPVQVFGVFVAIGVWLAWLCTITLVPAFILLMPATRFAHLERVNQHSGETHGWLARNLQFIGVLSVRHSKGVLAVFLFMLIVAAIGIERIRVNDNPIKWFDETHDIRVAERVLNGHFGGAYTAYLSIGAEQSDSTDVRRSLARGLDSDASQRWLASIAATVDDQSSYAQWLDAVTTEVDKASTGEDEAALLALLDTLEAVQSERQLFKHPQMLRWLEGVQQHLEAMRTVGKATALPDVVKTVHRDLFLGADEAFVIPDSQAAVAQTLITYQNSHRPQDLFKLVTPDYRQSVVWLQMTSGDNIDMMAVTQAMDVYIADNPPPVDVSHHWFGLTYLNTVWQQHMVKGMGVALASSFLVVLILMTVLFRSLLWGLLSMAPLSVSIATIYGVIGLLGRDYDMPIAVLSSLSLGLAVDYAIHINARARALRRVHPDWPSAARAVYAEPAVGIARNMIILGIGFLPLLLSPLVPYQTVGLFISAILLCAGITSFLGLGALITVFQSRLFKHEAARHVLAPGDHS